MLAKKQTFCYIGNTSKHNIYRSQKNCSAGTETNDQIRRPSISTIEEKKTIKVTLVGIFFENIEQGNKCNYIYIYNTKLDLPEH